MKAMLSRAPVEWVHMWDHGVSPAVVRAGLPKEDHTVSRAWCPTTADSPSPRLLLTPSEADASIVHRTLLLGSRPVRRGFKGMQATLFWPPLIVISGITH